MTHLDQVTIAAADFPASLGFYKAALGALGLVLVDELVDEEEDDSVLEAAGWGPPEGTAVLWLVSGTPVTKGLHVRLKADSRSQVETFYGLALGAGGTGYAAPRRWAVYRRGEFNAIVRDPDGNLVEAVAGE